MLLTDGIMRRDRGHGKRPGALDAQGAALEDVGVDRGGADVFVAEELLDCPDVEGRLQEVGWRRNDEGLWV